MHQDRIVIVGAAGRDVHTFNVLYRDDPSVHVVAFTTSRLPAGRIASLPMALAGPRYPNGVPFVPMAHFEAVLADSAVDSVVYVDSNVSSPDALSTAAIAAAHGVDFTILSPLRTMLTASKPVIAVSSCRRSAGKTPTVRFLTRALVADGLRVVVVRHPHPWGSLTWGVPHRFGSLADLDRALAHETHREEYESLVRDGAVIYSGIDFAKVLAEAEKEADVIIWDGGNNDLPFLKPDLHLLVVDAVRGDRETLRWPAEVGLRTADLVVINKCDLATSAQVANVLAGIREVNPKVAVFMADSPVVLDNGDAVRGKTVVVIENSSSLPLEEIQLGAGTIAARSLGVSAILSAAPNAVGAIREVFQANPGLVHVLPAMAQSPEQVADLQATLDATMSEAFVSAATVDLRRIVTLSKPVAWARFEMAPQEPERMLAFVREHVGARVS